MTEEIDKSVLETHKGNSTLPSDLRLKLLETIGVVNELVEDVHQIAHAVADLIARQRAAAEQLKDNVADRIIEGLDARN